MKLGYIGIDSYGNYYQIKKHPRKELMEQLHSKHADKLYIDTLDGKSNHVGYIIGCHWIQVYEVHEWKGGN